MTVQPRRLKGGLYAGLAALALAELALPRVLKVDHAHFWFEDLPAWGSMYGLAACLVIIVASKLLGKFWLTRPENYYDS
jgi:hypothetical protein